MNDSGVNGTKFAAVLSRSCSNLELGPPISRSIALAAGRATRLHTPRYGCWRDLALHPTAASGQRVRDRHAGTGHHGHRAAGDLRHRRAGPDQGRQLQRPWHGDGAPVDRRGMGVPVAAFAAYVIIAWPAKAP